MNLLMTRQFNGLQFDCYQDEQQQGSDNQFWATREQIGRLLGYSEPRNAITIIHKRNKERLDKFSRGTQIDSPSGGMQMTTVYNFKGLLEICRFSNQPNANAVMDFIWEVADEIRTKGMYITPAKMQEIMQNPDVWINVLQALKAEQQKVKALTEQAEADKPKIVFAESVETSENSILIRELAKLLRQNGCPFGQNRLFQELRERGYLMKCGTDYNMPTQKSMELGLMEIRVTSINRGEGEIRTYRTPKITGKGQIFFINLFLGKKCND